MIRNIKTNCPNNKSEVDVSNEPNDLHSRTIFYIADPSTGRLSFTTGEFCRKWLSAQVKSSKEGIVLALEPTPSFYAEEGEKAL